MPSQRRIGKKLIGAQASPELWRGVDAWLRTHKGATVTDFLTAACLEKLKKDNIPVNEDEAVRDWRARMPHHYPAASPQNLELNDK
jgi:hypothetical protein